MAIKCRKCQSALNAVSPEPTAAESAPEVVLVRVAANLFRGAEAVGGHMQITNRRILFQPHAINTQKKPAEILLTDVTEVGKRNTLGVVPNGMNVRTKDGVEYKFVVWGRDKLIKRIEAGDKDRKRGRA